ncbi:MAG: hypothetical protein RI564_00455 [Gracilimonas sp.]|nr:hypothetical protein [Gracilimonas sp.]
MPDFKNSVFAYIIQCRSKKYFSIFYWVSRAAMGIGFIGSGVRKLPGVKFTVLPVENPVGHFFEAMYQTGFYWNTIGAIQILLGLMIFFDRSVVAATLVMMPVTINIFLASVALQMTGTPIITSAMLLANIFLLLWHFENYLSIIQKPKYLTDDIPD